MRALRGEEGVARFPVELLMDMSRSDRHLPWEEEEEKEKEEGHT